MEERDKQLGVPVTAQEMEMVKVLARREGMTMSAYVRYIVRQLYMNGIAIANRKEQNNEV